MMPALTFKQIASALDADLAAGVDGGQTVSGVCIDSRGVKLGDVFVALRGERVDGHDFLESAASAGAAAAIVEQPQAVALPQFVVRDTRIALGQLANLNRIAWSGTLLALTGSAGKTSTKEMIAAICAKSAQTLSTEGNFNNEIGVPLTLFRLAPEHRFAVVEMGAAKSGDIAYLTHIARPDVVLITNAMAAHLEGFGSLDGVAQTKGEIYRTLDQNGVAVLNIDDNYAPLWREMIGARRIVAVSASGNKDADVRAVSVQTDAAGSSFTLEVGANTCRVRLSVLGAHQIANAVAAAGLATAAGISLETIARGLESVRPVAGRMDMYTSAAGATVIDDTYNANPGSVRAAIDALASMKGERVLVLGAMAELGSQAAELHRQTAAYAAKKGVDRLFCVGAFASDLAAGFGSPAVACESKDALITALLPWNKPDTCFLIKGSRSARMEHVVQALMADATNNNAEAC